MDIVEQQPGRRRGGRRGPYAKTPHKRREILDAALEVFARSGYRAGSLRDVAERVGMSEAGLLHHFPNKSALLAAVLERRDELTTGMVRGDSEDPILTLHGLVRLAAYNASVPGVVELYCVLSAEATSPEHPAHGYFHRRYEWVRGVLTRTFQLLAAQGALRPGVSPESAARTIIAVMDGLQVQWLYDRDTLDMAEELRRYLDRLATVEWHWGG